MIVCKGLGRKRVAVAMQLLGVQPRATPACKYSPKSAFMVNLPFPCMLFVQKTYCTSVYFLLIEGLHRERCQVTSDGLQDSPSKTLSPSFQENRKI